MPPIYNCKNILLVFFFYGNSRFVGTFGEHLAYFVVYFCLKNEREKTVLPATNYAMLSSMFVFFCREMIQHRPYNQKVDVYSFGIVLWELITGLLPFQNMTAVQAAFAVVNKGVRPIIPHDCLPVLAEIMTRCWDANPEVRPSFAEVVQMLENAETEILTTVRKARFRCCMTQPMTAD